MKHKTLITLCVGLFTAAPLVAVELYDEAPIDDAYTDSVQTNTTFNTIALQIQGFGPDTPVGEPDVVSVQNSYLKFDVSSLAEKKLLSAVFGVYLLENSGYLTPSLQLHYVDDDTWTETDFTWANSPGSTEMIGTPEQTDQTGRYYEWNVFPGWKGDELTDGFVTYMLTVDQTDLDNYAYFSSSENSANRPYLRIEYIPEPATLLLLGMGGVLMRRRE